MRRAGLQSAEEFGNIVLKTGANGEGPCASRDVGAHRTRRQRLHLARARLDAR